MSTPDTHRWGFFEAPAIPPARRLHVDPTWSARRLSGAIIGSAWPWAVAGALLLVIFNIASMLLPVVIGQIIDRVIWPASTGTAGASVNAVVVGWLAGLLGVYVTMHLAYRFGGRLGWYGVQRCQYELSQTVLQRVLDERGMAGSTVAPGRLLTLATGDVHRACQVMYVAIYPLGELVGLAVAAGIVVSIHPALGLGVIGGLPVVLVLMHRTARPLRRRSMAEQAGLADAAEAAADLVAGYRVIRGLHAQDTVTQRYAKISQNTLRATLAARAAAAGFDGISTAAAQLFAAAVMIAAAALTFANAMTVGELVTVAGIAVTLLGPLDALVGTLGAMWAISQASATRVLELLNTPPNPAAQGSMPVTDDTRLAFDNLDLPDNTVLHADIEPGQFVVLDVSGPARKTIVDVLTCRTSPTNGRITVNGVPVSDLDPGELRSQVLVTPHVPGIFAGTVLDNAHGDRQALHTAGFSDTELPGGYETQVSDGGYELSGGQRQRIALARALAAHPPVLVLDDPTSSVDAVTQQRITTALQACRRGTTTLVLSSSPAFRAVADVVVIPQRQHEERPA